MTEKVPLEKVIVSQIISFLKDAGYKFIYKTHGSAYQTAGLPDIVLIDRNGRFVGLECKRPGVGRLTQLQASFLNRIAEAGGYAAIVTSVEDARKAMAAAEAGAAVSRRFTA